MRTNRIPTHDPYTGDINPLYEEYLIWLKETHDLTPEDVYSGVNVIDGIVANRDEYSDKNSLVYTLAESGGYLEEIKLQNTIYKMITFDEYVEFKRSV